MILYKEKWGLEEDDCDEGDRCVAQVIMREMFEQHHKNLKIDSWIVDHRHKIAKKELEKYSGNLNQEEVKASKRILNIKLRRELSQSKDVEPSSQGLDPSPEEQELEKKDQTSPNRRREFTKEQKVQTELLERDKSPKTEEVKTPTKKDIKKKKLFFEAEPENRYVPRARNEESFEDFAEFEKIVPMVRQSPHERPQLQDMNKVLAEKIKGRYRSTDRFIRVQR